MGPLLHRSDKLLTFIRVLSGAAGAVEVSLVSICETGMLNAATREPHRKGSGEFGMQVGLFYRGTPFCQLGISARFARGAGLRVGILSARGSARARQ